MTTFILRRVLGMVPSFLLLMFLVVFMLELIPGNIIDAILGEDAGNVGARAALTRKLGLDRPLPLRFVEYVGNVARGDLGVAYETEQPVSKLIMARLPVSIEIGAISIILGTIAGALAGVIAAVKQDSASDVGLRLTATFWNSVPSFAVATAIVVFPAIWWNVTLSLRYVSFMESPLTHLQIIVVPTLLLAFGHAAGLIRLVRTQMLEVLRQDYIRTARAKGLSERIVIVRHGLKNALIPVVTILGLQVAALLSGSVITETIFGIPGAGRLLTTSIQTRDYPVVQGIVVVVGLFVMTVNLMVDISYAWLDPRIKFS